MVGSSLENKGGRELLDAIARLFPSPLERPAFLDANGNERASNDEGPACGLVFKTIADPFSGQLNMVRVISGTISSESTLERELAPLLSVRDAFPKVLIARTRHEPYTREGVLVLNFARWLLGG